MTSALQFARMTTRIEILAGIAGSGKTQKLLATYRAALQDASQSGRFGSALWLTPTNRSRHAVLERLCDGPPGVLFSPNVLTFKDFAERILRDAPEATTPLSPTMQWVLLRRIIDRLKDDGQLPHYRGIADTAGFLDLVSAFIAEMKRSELWPERFVDACRRRGERPRDRELHRIYENYQTALRDQNVYDSEGSFWSARQALQRGQWGPFAGLSLVVADGFTDFTPTQRDLLLLLAEHAGTLHLSLPLERPLLRRDLFAKSQSVRDGLPAGVIETWLDSGPGGTSAVPKAVDHIARTLFSNPRTLTRAPSAAGIEILAAAGPAGEVAGLAARIKGLLQSGVAPGEIVVAIRDLADYDELISEAFSRAGIPFRSSADRSLDRLPLCRAAVAWVQLEVEDWPSRRLMAVLESSLFRPDWNELHGGQAVRDVARVLRHFNLTGGREALLKRLESLSQTPESDRAPGGQGREAVRKALALLNKLSKAMERLRRSHDLAGWAGAISGLVAELSPIAPGAPGQPAADDASERLARVLFDAARVETNFLGSRSQKFGPQQFLQELNSLLRNNAYRDAVPETGRVRVVSAEQVRNLDISHLFLAGLTERSFPRRRAEDCLYTESDRQELIEHGLPLTPHSQRAQEEMLMFYTVVTRARRSLVLSYPVVSAAGEPFSCSPYLDALRELFLPGALQDHLEEQLDPVPPADRILSIADARLRGMAEALEENRPGLLRAACQVPSQAAAAENLLAAVDMNVCRFHTSGFTRFEGLLENSDNLAWLARRFGPDHLHSATQLEEYAACPFEFFLAQVLEIEPLAEIGIETDFGRRGTLVHAVLAQLHREMTNPEMIDDPAALAGRFRQVLREQLKARPPVSELERTLEAIEIRLLDEWASAYAAQWSEYRAGQPQGMDQPLWPASFEATFGERPGPSDPAAVDPAGPRSEPALPPLVVGAGDRAVRVGGRIDRIDIGRIGGQSVFAVVDYKTGATWTDSLDAIASGQALQLALYTLAVMRLGMAGADATPLQMGYWFVRGQGFAPSIKQGRSTGGRLTPLDPDLWSQVQDSLETVVPHMAAAMRGGRFPVDNPDLLCTSHCPFRTGCRVAQIRPLAQTLQKSR